ARCAGQNVMRRILLLFVFLAMATGAADPKNLAELERAYQDIIVAKRALDHAKQRRDRPARDSGKGYDFDRQRSLEREVALAPSRYYQALERWHALKTRSPSEPISACGSPAGPASTAPIR